MEQGIKEYIVQKSKLIVSVFFLFLGISLWLVYRETFNAPYQFDDHVFVVGNPLFRLWNDPIQFFQEIRYQLRFVAFYSFALNYALHYFEPFGFHLTNFLIHFINTLLVFMILKEVYQLVDSFNKKEEAIFPAMMGSLLFALHPLQTQAVTYISQRLASLVALFYLLSILFFILFRKTKLKRYFVLLFFSIVLGVLTKENFFSLPLLLLLIDFLFFRNDKSARFYRIWIYFFAVVVFLGMCSPRINRVYISESNQFELIHSANYFVTQWTVIWKYIRLWFVPLGQHLDYYYPVAEVTHWYTLLCGFALLALLVLAIRFYRGHRWLTFFIGWFFITLSIESSIIPIRHLIFEHRMYLPSVGIAGLVAFYLYRFAPLKMFVPVILIWVIILGNMTFQRNKVWLDPTSLWADSLRKSPQKFRPYANYGAALTEKSRFNEALFYLNKAIDMNPLYTEAILNRGVVFASMNQREFALQDFNRAIELHPQMAQGYYNRGHVYRIAGSFDLALKDYAKTMEITPNFVDVYTDRGGIYFAQKKYELALKDFEYVVAELPWFAPGYYNLAKVKYQLQDFEQARQAYEKSQELGFQADKNFEKLLQRVLEMRRK